MLVHFIQHILMMAPAWVEAYGDRNGDNHDSFSDLVVRGAMICIAGGLVSIWRISEHQVTPDEFVPILVECVVMSFAYFCAGFQYLVNWYERKLTGSKWWNHLNKVSYPDKWKWYRAIPWQLRIVLHGMFIVAGLWYYYY